MYFTANIARMATIRTGHVTKAMIAMVARTSVPEAAIKIVAKGIS